MPVCKTSLAILLNCASRPWHHQRSGYVLDTCPQPPFAPPQGFPLDPPMAHLHHGQINAFGCKTGITFSGGLGLWVFEQRESSPAQFNANYF